MKKRDVIGLISAAVLVLAVLGIAGSQTPTSTLNAAQPINVGATATSNIKKAPPACDGTTVTTNCAIEGVSYTSYVYHPAVAEVSHNETNTTYHDEVTGYCTLCNDGTYSPTCATGSGTCSHHHGVAQWNAPRYSSVPETTTTTIVDTPAQEAYYDKVAK